MKHLSVAQIAKKWNLSERSVRNYCAQGRVNGAFLNGKTEKFIKELHLILKNGTTKEAI